MQDVALDDLSAPIRDFLVSAREKHGVVIRDGTGHVFLRLEPGVSAEERERARQSLRRVQAKIGESLRSQGVTEEEFDRIVQEGD